MNGRVAPFARESPREAIISTDGRKQRTVAVAHRGRSFLVNHEPEPRHVCTVLIAAEEAQRLLHRAGDDEWQHRGEPILSVGESRITQESEQIHPALLAIDRDGPTLERQCELALAMLCEGSRGSKQEGVGHNRGEPDVTALGKHLADLEFLVRSKLLRVKLVQAIGDSPALKRSADPVADLVERRSACDGRCDDGRLVGLAREELAAGVDADVHCGKGRSTRPRRAPSQRGANSLASSRFEPSGFHVPLPRERTGPIASGEPLGIRSVCMSVLGIDLAARAKKTYACALESVDGTLRGELFAGCDDELLLALAQGRAKVAIDAPFGWPSEFVDALNAHRHHESWPAPDDGLPDAFRAALSFRATDRVVMHTRRPLSVSTDKVGVTAMRCAYLLDRWSSAGEAVDRAGGQRFVEVYPAGALVRWGLPGSGYKGTSQHALSMLAGRLLTGLPQLLLSQHDRALCETVDDAFDALVAALVAQAAFLGLTDRPPPNRLEQAQDEGWIHLPLRGSLPVLARPRRDLRARPAPALAKRLAASGVAVTASGYTERFDDALLAEFSEQVKAAIRADLSGKGGSELVVLGKAAPKFQAAHSSACLAANVFGPWLVVEQALPLGAESFCGETHLEVECPTGLRGTPPTLDCLVAGRHVLAVESKCTETFEAHEAVFRDVYDEVVTSLAHPTWRMEYERLVEDPRRYRFLDAAQLIKHYLGLRRQFPDRPVTLAYLFWEPINARDIATCIVHSAELAEFAGRVGDPRVRFVGVSYRALWSDWAQSDRPPWLRDHVTSLRRRYDVAI